VRGGGGNSPAYSLGFGRKECGLENQTDDTNLFLDKHLTRIIRKIDISILIKIISITSHTLQNKAYPLV
jgi:hypothetical protein